MRARAYTEDLLKQHQDLSDRIEEVLELAGVYPDLNVYLHGRVERFASAGVNSEVDVMETMNSREPWASVLVFPYVLFGSQRIYSDPPGFVVGTVDPQGLGISALVNWWEPMRDAGISPEMIRNVGKYLRGHTE